MKIEIKNLQNDTFHVEIDDNETVKALKEKIAARDDLREKYDPELLKLLCTGRVMDDENMLDTYTIKPDGFLVLVKQTPGKPKPPPKKKPNEGFNNSMSGFNSTFGMTHMSNSFMQQPFEQHSLSHQSFPQASFTPNSQFSATEITGNQSSTIPNMLPTDGNREKDLNDLMAMGFERIQVEQALRFCSNNVEAAIDCLISGNILPDDDNVQLPLETGSSASIIQGNQSSLFSNQRQGGGGMGTSLQEINRMLQQNPNQLQTIKQTIQAEHPEIAKMIDENPQAFLNLVRQAAVVPDEDDDNDDDDDDNTTHAPAGNIGGHPQGPITVSLTVQEQQTINRLQEMGFDRNRAIEAYLACDRNEELAVHYLLSAFE